MGYCEAITLYRSGQTELAMQETGSRRPFSSGHTEIGVLRRNTPLFFFWTGSLLFLFSKKEKGVHAGDRIRTCEGTKPPDLESGPFDRLGTPAGPFRNPHSRDYTWRELLCNPVIGLLELGQDRT